jgi:glycosyltransferase involved in cell wall biosynthesis
MNILFLLPQIPYPPHSGGRIVTWNTIKRFSQQCTVRIACLYHHPSELEHLSTVESHCQEIAVFPAYNKWSITPFMKSMVSTIPYKAYRFLNKDMVRHIQELLQRESIEVIHAQNFYTASYVTGTESCLKVHYKENVEGNILQRYSRYSRNPLIKAAAFVEGVRTRRYELSLCRRFDQVLTISPLDRDVLLRMDQTLPIKHQSPGVDLSAYPYLDENNDVPSIVFTGTMSYYPNAIGVEKFIHTLWGQIRSSIPNAECWIVGDKPSQSIRDFDGKDGIHVTGRVPSVDSFLQKASVYIVPLTIGEEYD